MRLSIIIAISDLRNEFNAAFAARYWFGKRYRSKSGVARPASDLFFSFTTGTGSLFSRKCQSLDTSKAAGGEWPRAAKKNPFSAPPHRRI